MEELLYGAAYYHEYMPSDRLKQDIEMLKAANMNVVRIAESTWSSLEPEDGVYNFKYIDEVLGAMEEAGIYVIVGTPTYAMPSWLANKDPEILATTKAGRELYGRRQNMDIVNKTFRFYAERIIRVLMEHVSKRQCIIGYQIDNETKHYGTAGAYVQQLFAEYLKEKFVTVENINKAFGFAYWSNALGKWEDLPDVRGTINASYACEFERFQRSLVTKYLRWQADIIKEYKREEQFITHNFDFEWKKFGAAIAQDGYSYGIQPDVNHFEAAKAVTLAGTDIYHMTQEELTGSEIAFGGDIIRSLKQDNYLVLETEAQAFKNWLPFDGQLRLQAYSHIASGAAGVMYWHWHSIHNSFETYWKGLLSHDMKSNPTYEEAKVIGSEFKKLSPKLSQFKKVNKVAMLVSNESLTALKWFPIDKDLSYNDVVRWMYDALYKMNIECDFIYEGSENLEDYKMIVAPALYCAPEALLLRLKEFVKNGGTLIASFKSAVANENVTVYSDDQPHLLTKCFGLSYNQFTEPKNVDLEGLALNSEDKKVTCWMELLKAEGAEILAKYSHKYWGKYAAITRNRYHKGQAYYIGCYTSEAALQKVYQAAMEEVFADEDKPACSWPIIVRKGITEEGKKLYFYLNYSMDDQSVLCVHQKVHNLLTGKVYNKGDLIFLKDWDACILEEGD